MRYDAILVLGRGIRKDGSITESATASVEKAIELMKMDLADFVVFSGKWSYQLAFHPPTTEADAMAKYALDLGLDSEKILIEDKSVTTVTNIIYCKRQFLIPRDLYHLAVVYIEPFGERMRINLAKVLGEKFDFELIKANFSFSKEKLEQLEQIELGKRKEAADFLKQFQDGDDLMIEKESLKEISF